MLKPEEIYANRYRDFEHLRRSIEVFIEQYYNRARLHSVLGYRPPEEFEHAVLVLDVRIIEVLTCPNRSSIARYSFCMIRSA